MERTFEELIDEKFGLQFDKSEKEEIKELMQHVAEAKIAECGKAIEDNTTLELYKSEWDEISNALNSIPTDRISPHI